MSARVPVIVAFTTLLLSAACASAPMRDSQAATRNTDVDPNLFVLRWRFPRYAPSNNHHPSPVVIEVHSVDGMREVYVDVSEQPCEESVEARHPDVLLAAACGDGEARVFLEVVHEGDALLVDELHGAERRAVGRAEMPHGARFESR